MKSGTTLLTPEPASSLSGAVFNWKALSALPSCAGGMKTKVAGGAPGRRSSFDKNTSGLTGCKARRNYTGGCVMKITNPCATEKLCSATGIESNQGESPSAGVAQW